MSYYNPYPVSYGYQQSQPMGHDARGYGAPTSSYVRSDTSSYGAPSYPSSTMYSSNTGYTSPQPFQNTYNDRAQYPQRTAYPEPVHHAGQAWSGMPSSRAEPYAAPYHQEPSAAAPYARREEAFSPNSERPQPQIPPTERSDSRTGSGTDRTAKPAAAQPTTGLVGVGVVFQQYDDGNMYIKSLVPGEAATLANPRPNEGDCIIGVDDKEVLGCDLGYLRSLIMGRPSTAVILRLRRPNGAVYTTIIIRGARSDAAVGGMSEAAPPPPA
eukprot:CAMPEP_0113722832 /NCGR_PEP_ID=MMETSP0038_2-20120614/38014_1 /TAXON_ID=2898 /ORGANISM="Cryptomonas paramecium" /LENGTH=268 /DNA_ID=CAMNT_0000652209 /DNA_START=6 /DNA_END=808 /DNA_ORIENTATION=+ /assembly_acc=CAM_ASM_000170